MQGMHGLCGQSGLSVTSTGQLVQQGLSGSAVRSSACRPQGSCLLASAIAGSSTFVQPHRPVAEPAMSML